MGESQTDGVSEVKRLKKLVENSYEYFRKNYERFNLFNKFVFLSSISSQETLVNNELERPNIEFNICEAYLSRLRGEFSKQEPSVSVESCDGAEVEPETIELVQSHLNYVINDASNDNLEYDVYTDLLAGGFSVMEVYTEYQHPMSMLQNICISRNFDPTLCGFDPLSQKSHKGDGRFCFKIYPKTKQDAKDMGIDTDDITFQKNVEGFTWSYETNNEEILMVCDLFEKKKKRVQIVELINGKTLELSKYKKFVKQWNEANITAVAPGIKGKPRWTELETIVRHRFIENKIIDTKETDFRHLPLVFVDGNSRMIRDSSTGSISQVTRPYVYHMEGTQRLKNYAGQALANELENMVMHKFIVCKESIPPESVEAYENVQKADVLIYNGFKDNNVDVPLNPPREVIRPPIPPEITNTFKMCDEVSQVILGSYDASLGINNNQLSGVAMVEGATQSNAAAMPYVVGFIKGLNRVAEIYVDLFPKYVNTPRTVPVLLPDGKRDVKKINQTPETRIKYNSNELNVKVEAGVNFAIQKSRSLQQVTALMQVSKMFNEFMNSRGLPVLIDNLEINGTDQLKKEAKIFMEQVQQQQQMQQQQMQQQQQMGMIANPVIAKTKTDMMKIQQQGQESQSESMLRLKELEVEEKKIIAGIMKSQNESEIERMRAEVERNGQEVRLELEHRDMAHRHAHDIVKFKKEGQETERMS